MPITGTTKALEYSRLKVMRLGVSRLGYYQPWFKVTIAGLDQTSHIRISNCTITQELNQTHTMSCRVSGITPTAGQEIKLFMGDTAVATCLFAGHVLKVTTAYEDLNANVCYDLSCVDYSWPLTFKTVFASYVSVSATTIVQSLMSTYATWATVGNVAPGLAAVTIQFSGDSVKVCLDKIAQAIGGYYYIDYGKDLNFFVVNALGSAQPVTDAHGGTATTGSWALNVHDGSGRDVDYSQARNRIIASGNGSTASCNLAAGTTTLPVLDGALYSASGGIVEVGAQRITYTGKSTGDGLGALTAGTPGSAPSPPSPSESTPYATGTLVQGGTYKYICSFVSALGESAASAPTSAAIAAVPHGFNDGPGFVSGAIGGSLVSGGSYAWVITYVTASGEVGYSPSGLSIWNLGIGNTQANLTGLPVSSDGRVTGRKLYRTTNGGSGFALVATLNNVATTYADTTADGSLGAAMPFTDSGSTGQFAVGIPLGDTGTTARKLYRTVINGASYLLQSTTADNTTGSVADNTADGSLGAAFSGSTLGASPGDATLAVTDLSKFPNGGWVRAGSQVISYTARSAVSGGGNLTGIPTSGQGSITAIIPSGSTITNEPFLVGIPVSSTGAILSAINGGDTVAIRVDVNDAPAQTALAAALGYGDGVIEHPISDASWDIPTATAEAMAELALYKNPIQTVRATARDQSATLARSVSFTLTNPPISGMFQIQRITLSDIAIAGSTVNWIFPLRTIEASTVRDTLENVLQTLLRKTT